MLDKEKMINYSNYLYLAIRAAIDAGQAIMTIYGRPEAEWEVELKADRSPLTLADKAAHKLITDALSVTPFPILSEEGREIPFKERKRWKTLWVVDPLDGTKEFIKHNGEFTVNIALVTGGVPVAGVIYIPVRKELYYGAETEGAFKLISVDYATQPSINEIRQRSLRLPYSRGHQGIVVVASRSHQTEETTLFIESLRKQGQPVTMISSGSSLKLCLIAEGTADIYPRFAPTMEWDTAAGHAILRAAGCEIYQTDRKTPLHYNKEDLHNPWFISECIH